MNKYRSDGSGMSATPTKSDWWGEACRTCLARGRRLAPLLPPLRALCADLLAPLTHTDGEEMSLCWECNGTLRNTMRFKMRATRAHRWLERVRNLQDAQEPLRESLSSLKYSVKTLYDLDVSHENQTVKEEIKDDTSKQEAFSDNDTYLDTLVTDSEYVALDDEKGVYIKAEPVDLDVMVECDSAINSTERKKKNRPKGLKYKKRYKLLDKSEKQTIIEKRRHLKLYDTVTVTEEELHKIMERDRNDAEYKSSKYRCEKCIIIFRSETKQQQHQKKYHPLKRGGAGGGGGGAACAVCEARFASAARRDEHAAAHLRCHRCRACGRLARGARDMRRHHGRAHAAPHYRCVTCSAEFATVRDLSRHRQQLHKCYICDTCGLRFHSPRTIEKHIFSRHMPFRCGECGLQVSSRHALRLHHYRRHQSHAPDAAAYCVECDKQFRHRLAYRAHLKVVHRSRTQFACPDCGKQFSRKIYMQNHLDLLHRNNSKNQCLQCNKAFLRPDALRRHVQHVHEGKSLPKTKVCDICGRAFQTNRILVNHRRTHTGERPYKCELCAAAFAQKTALKSHVKHIHLHVVRSK